MPGTGFSAANMKRAREMLEACRFVYKMYAQTCVYPLDPFYECTGASDSARSRVMPLVHRKYGTGADATKFDPVDYDLITVPNPSKSICFRGGIEDEPYILFQPREYDRKIGHHAGFDLAGRAVRYGGGDIADATGRRRCAFFQGKTGMTKTHPTSGWPSWLGAVVYDPTTNEATIVFRGSRSGNGTRALKGAKLHSTGSPDWVTDMNFLKTVEVPEFNGAAMSCGFYYAYTSCRDSLAAAYKSAVGSAVPAAIYVTGHSLGGALAQVAYLDLTGGDLATRLFYGAAAARGISTYSPVTCFAISAPPIACGTDSHRKLSLAWDASQVLHYFCPGDAVHSSVLLDTDLIPAVVRTANYLGTKFSASRTDPIQLGVEIQLESESMFPEAHEPRDVYKGMNAGTLDGEFWPTFKFNHTAAAGPYVSDVSAGAPEEDIREALVQSISPDRALARAMLWREVITNSKNVDKVNVSIGKWESAIELVESLRRRDHGGLPRVVLKDVLDSLRRELVAGTADSNGTATSSCYWTLLQGLTAAEYAIGR